MYAVVELKYDEGKTFVAPIHRILNYKPKFNKTDDFLFYWSSNLQDSADQIECGYSMKFTGDPSLFKVFILKVASKFILISSFVADFLS